MIHIFMIHIEEKARFSGLQIQSFASRTNSLFTLLVLGLRDGSVFLLAILAIGRTVSLVLCFLLRHVLTGLSIAIPARTGTVIDVSRRIDPDSD